MIAFRLWRTPLNRSLPIASLPVATIAITTSAVSVVAVPIVAVSAAKAALIRQKGGHGRWRLPS